MKHYAKEKVAFLCDKNFIDNGGGNNMSIADKITRLQTAKSNISDAITAKGGTVAVSDGFEEFANDVGTIMTPQGTLDITENGVYDVAEYAEANVQTPVPSGTYYVSNNGTYNVSAYANVEVEVIDDTLNYLIQGSLSGVIIPDNVAEIRSYCFKDIAQLEYVELNSSLMFINSHAFDGCTQLSGIDFSECHNLGLIDNYAFYNCYALGGGSPINMTETSIEHIGASAFENTNLMGGVKFSTQLRHIGDSAFANTSIIKPDFKSTSLMFIGESCFANCAHLQTITLPATVNSIGDDCFFGCPNLTTIKYAGSAGDWNNITIGVNAIPAGVNIVYNS